MIKKLLCLFLLPAAAVAQDDLLAGADTIQVSQNVESAFKGLKIINLESTKLAAKKDLYFIVAHRFGSVKDGIDGFFGLDNAVTQIKFVYGVTNWLTAGIARSEQAYDVSAKYRLVPQTTSGSPVTVAAFNSIAFNNTLKPSLYPKMSFEHRLAYVTQILVSRKFSEKLSLQLSPTLWHENFVVDDRQDNTQYAVGFGGRYKIATRWSLNMDYAAHLNPVGGFNFFQNPLSIGVDIETGGHVFQMHFTTAQQIHEAGFLSNVPGDWRDGNVFFGFNLLRVF